MKYVLNRLKELRRAVLEDDELLTLQAKLMKKMYDELVKAGFTEVVAAQIVVYQGVGGIKVND